MWIGGLLLYLATALSNLGIIATDDYDYLIAWIIPAQSRGFLEVAAASGHRSPFAALVLLVFTKLALALGLTDPAWQLRLALCAVGAFNFWALARFSMAHFSDEGRKRLALFLVAFYFLCPLLFTRPLIESLSAPFLLMSAHWACQGAYRKALAALVVASMFRYQAAVCYPALVAVILWRRRYRELPAFAAGSVAGFVISGLPDWALKGGFHASLWAYAAYQRENFASFGRQPFYVFPALFVGLSFPPTLWRRVRGYPWRELGPTALYFALFVLAHTLGVHKEERFMVPVVPLFLVLMVPLAVGLERWRVAYFCLLNFAMLPLVCFNAPQNNVIGLVRYLHRHPEVKVVTSVGESVLIFPSAFSAHPVTHRRISGEQAAGLGGLACDEVLAVRRDLRGDVPAHFRHLAEFQPGPLERLVIFANPLRNRRRGAVEIYGDPRCS